MKVKARETVEIIIGAVIGPITAPDAVVAGLYRDGALVIAGRSVPLTPAQSRSLAAVLTPAGTEHPWPDSILANRFSSGRDRVTITKVQPTVIAEVAADPALQAGVWRHGLRYQRYRPELHPDDIPTLSEHAQKGG